jgi:site-specific DNA recombinase
MEPAKASNRRCAIYTRKSSEEGLEQDFNSLHAQREACEAFIKSQTGEGWRLVKTAYDDGGLSGGTMERPALRRLLADINQGMIDVVVVYKVDRLTRSLADFAKMVEVFDAHGVSFVAVTQQFNTTTSMGRLTLNVLLSFAQFEREVTGERIRDKIAASKRKGMWMGGFVPLGYDVCDRRVVIAEREAEAVRYIFRRYQELGCVRLLKEDLDRRNVLSKRRTSKTGIESGGHSFSRGALYALLSNPIYVGEIRHKNLRHPGRHQAIVDRVVWERTQQQLQEHRVRTKNHDAGIEKSPLIGRWGHFERGLNQMLEAKKCSKLAEREGFEPSVPVTQYARLATPRRFANAVISARLLKTVSTMRRWLDSSTAILPSLCESR